MAAKDFEFKTKPYKHQVESFHKFKYAKIAALNADMGVGKTKMAIDLLAFRHFIGAIDRVVVIAPNGVHAQWLDQQFPEHCPVAYEGLVYTASKTLKNVKMQDLFFYNCKESSSLCVMTINIESFARKTGLDLVNRLFSTSKKGCAVVVDEASKIKTPDISTTKNVKKIRSEYPDTFRITMTGTPAAKGPVNLWSIYDFLHKNYMKCSYIAFKMRHTVTFKKTIHAKGKIIQKQEPITEKLFDTVKRDITMRKNQKCFDDAAIDDIKYKYGLSDSNFWMIHNLKKFKKYKNVESLIHFIEPDTYSISKTDCLELPPKIKEKKYFELNKHQKELITNLRKYAIATYQGEELTLEVKALLGLRVLQICGGFFSHHTDIEGKYDVMPVKGKNAKLDFIKHDLMEVGNEQSIIWAVYRPEIDMLCKELSKDFSIGRLDGSDDNTENRRKTVNAFINGDIQHLVSHPEVGGMGYNFQNASVQYWYSRNYRTETRIQAEDRTYRIGTTRSPIYKDLLYNTPFEEIVYTTLQDEMAINAQFITNSFNKIEEKIKKDLTIDDIFGRTRKG